MKNKFLIGACSAAAVLAMASSAKAVSSIGIEATFSDSSTSGPFVVTDGGVGDNDGAVDGGILAQFQLQGLTFTVLQAGGQASGTQAPFLSLQIQGTLAVNESVKVLFSASGFSLPPAGSALLTGTENAQGPSGTYSFTSASWTSDSAHMDALFNQGNAMNAPQTLTALGTTENTALVPLATSNPYSVTIEADLSNTDTIKANVSATSILTTVPDGGNTLMLLGSALSILGLGAFRRKAKKA